MPTLICVARLSAHTHSYMPATPTPICLHACMPSCPRGTSAHRSSRAPMPICLCPRRFVQVPHAIAWHASTHIQINQQSTHSKRKRRTKAVYKKRAFPPPSLRQSLPPLYSCHHVAANSQNYTPSKGRLELLSIFDLTPHGHLLCPIDYDWDDPGICVSSPFCLPDVKTVTLASLSAPHHLPRGVRSGLELIATFSKTSFYHTAVSTYTYCQAFVFPFFFPLPPRLCPCVLVSGMSSRLMFSYQALQA